jgi:hypothetical protein
VPTQLLPAGKDRRPRVTAPCTWLDDPDAVAREAAYAAANTRTVISEDADGTRHLHGFDPRRPVMQTGNPELLLGYGGTPWRVTFLDGRAVETNDLYTAARRGA